MIFAIPLAEKVLAGLATIGANAADSAPSVETRKAGAAGATDFANALDGLDQTGAAANPQNGAHTAGASTAPAAG